MSSQLPKVIASYIEAYNSRDEKAASASFLGLAPARSRTRGKDHRGRKDIGEWIHEIDRKVVQPQLNPLVGGGWRRAKPVVAMTVSGNFPGSPVTLAFSLHDGGKVESRG
jgi:hypothetical protein